MSDETMIRDVTVDDADDILDLVTLCEIAEIGEATHTVDEVRPALGEEFRGWVVDATEGGLAAYAWAHRRVDRQSVTADVMVRPGRLELYGPLLARARAAAHELDASLPVRIFTDSGNGAKRRMLEANGGNLVRRFLRMVIDLPDTPEPTAPQPGPGVAIRTTDGEEADRRVMHSVVDVAFLDHYGHGASAYDDWSGRVARANLTDPTLWWLAYVDGEPAAGLLATMIPSGGYIDTLGTLRAHRGRGLGRLLLLTAFAEFRRRGARKASLGVDADNPTGAVELYQSVGMTAASEGMLYELP